jgi:hypothetical protein
MSAAMLGREQGRSEEDKEGGGGGGGGVVSDLPTKFPSLINIFPLIFYLLTETICR